MNTESEINFKDVALYVLRYILISIIVGAIVGGALCYSNYSEIKKTNDVLDITKKINAAESDFQYETRVLNVNKARTYVKIIDSLKNQLDYELEYNAEAIYMQINPDCVYQCTAQVSLTFENSNNDGIDEVLLSAYNRDIFACEYMQDYANKIGKKIDYIKECFSFSGSSTDKTIIIADNYDSNSTLSFYISVVGPTSEYCNDVLALIIDEMERVHNELSVSIVPHSLEVVGIQQIVKSDNGYRETQRGHINRVESIQSQLINYYNTLDNLAKTLGLSGKEAIINYFNAHEEVEVDGVPTEYSEQIINGHKDFKALSGQFGIGFGIGAGAIIVLLVICYLCSRKIKTQAQFFGIFPYIIKIGVMKPCVKNFYSKFINKCSEDDSKLSSENINKLILTNYNNITKEYQKVLITGIGDKSEMEKAVKELKIKGDFKPDMFNNPEVLDLVPNYDCVVLLEQRKKSLYRDIKNEIRLISNAGTKIVGAILI